MVAVSMAATIAICVGGFAFVFAAISPVITDFVPFAAPATTTVPTSSRGGPADIAQAEDTDTVVVAVKTETPPTSIPAPEPTPTAEAFQPSHQISASQSVNFRSGGSREAGVVTTLSPQTPLQFLDERAETTNPEDEPGWMRFRTEDNLEGWVREIDTDDYRP